MSACVRNFASKRFCQNKVKPAQTVNGKVGDVMWNGTRGYSFNITCGVRQGGVLSPYLFSVYIDDLIKELRQSGHGIYLGRVFVGCVVYADDIVLFIFSFYYVMNNHDKRVK